MNDVKQLMKLSKAELLGLGEKYGLSFEDSMKKSQMATALQQSMASGWLQEHESLMGTSDFEEEEFAGNLSSDMLSDSAHVAQMLASAGFSETFHNAMSDSLAHREVIESYLERLGANPDDVWKHLPRHNPNVTAPHWGEMRSYMENTLTKHQDIMPEIRGHYSGDIMGEYQTSKGDVKQTYDYLAQMYVDKSAYNNENLYNKDIQRVSTALAKNMERSFIEVSASAGMGAKVSYMDILPQIGSADIVGGVVHPREPLNSAGFPLGKPIPPSLERFAIGRDKYSLSASLTGRPDSKGGLGSEIWKDVNDTVKQLSKVYTSGGSDKTSIGLNPYGVETSERDMIFDSATRYVDIEDARSGYDNLYEPSYSGSTIRAIINNTYDKMDSQAQNVPSVINANQPSFRISNSTSWEAEMQQPTTWNSARDRRLERQIADFDAQGAHEQEAIDLANPIKFHNLEQGSQEWHDFRAKYDITGSTVGSYLGHSSYTRPWKELTAKLGLHPNAKGGNKFQEAMFARGHATEDATRRRLEREMGVEISQVGAITNEQYPGMMYSPDGLIGDDAIWEHKNPERAGKFADLSRGDHLDYMDQIQMGMMLSGRKRALFSQTIGDEVRNEWVDYDPEWYERNKTKLDSVRGRLAQGREFVANNPDLPQDELVAGARRVMTGSGIWKDVRQRSNRGYSPDAGTERDEYLGISSTYNPNLSQPSQDYSQAVQQSPSQQVANVPVPAGQNTTDPSLSPEQANMAVAVKSGILMAQEENKRAGGAGGGGFGGGGDGTGGWWGDEDFPDPNDPFGDRRRGRPSQDSGRRGREEGLFDSGAFGTIAEGISRGTMASTRSGVMQALREGGPIGQTAALAIGALGVGGEAISNMSDYLGVAQDYGSNNPVHFASMQQGLEMMGLSGEQATRTNFTTHSAYNTLLNGDPSGALRIIRGTRGLVTLSDIRETEGDPVALAERIRSKALERGWSQQRIAGAMQMAGLDGLARAVARPETQGYASGLVGERSQQDTEDFNHSIAMQNATRAFVSPDYFAQRYATGETAQNVLTGVAQGMKEGYMALDSGVGAIDSGLQKVYNQFNKLSSQLKGATSGDQFEAQDYGEAGVELGAQRDADGNLANLINGTMFWESRGRDYKADGTPMTSSTGAKYAMQVLPSSAKQPGYGIKPAQDDSPEEYNRVGREIIEVMNKKYDGDWRKVASAYSDGAGTVDKAVKLYGEDWLSHMPEQARNRIKAMEQAGFGQMGASGFQSGNYGANNINVNVNIEAKVNNQVARANVTSGNTTVTQTMNMGNGVMQQIG